MVSTGIVGKRSCDIEVDVAIAYLAASIGIDCK